MVNAVTKSELISDKVTIKYEDSGRLCSAEEGGELYITTEELYQAFKARILEEVSIVDISEDETPYYVLDSNGLSGLLKVMDQIW